jgi:hypothetical protein
MCKTHIKCIHNKALQLLFKKKYWYNWQKTAKTDTFFQFKIFGKKYTIWQPCYILVLVCWAKKCLATLLSDGHIANIFGPVFYLDWILCFNDRSGQRS